MQPQTQAMPNPAQMQQMNPMQQQMGFNNYQQNQALTNLLVMFE
jgi:hypothetical protein